MARRSPPRKVTYFEPVPPRLARNTIRCPVNGTRACPSASMTRSWRTGAPGAMRSISWPP